MEMTHGLGARVVFDPVGGPSFEPLTQSMSRGGILLEYGALSSEPTPFPLFTVLSKSLTLKGFLYLGLVPEMSFPRAAHVARFCIAMTNCCEREFLLLWAVPTAKSAK